MKGQGNANGLLPGVALSFSVEKSGMVMGYTATSVEDKISDDMTFEVTVPKGYDVMTMDEMQTMGM